VVGMLASPFAGKNSYQATRKRMQKKKTFSTMEIILLVVLIGSLILSFIQAWREEKEQ
jgi:hypothetical protein